MKLKKFQQGGMVDPGMAQDPAMAPQDPGMGAQDPAMAGGSPEDELIQMAMEIVQSLGPEGSMMLAEAIMMVVQETAQPQEAPVYAKRGGKLVKIK